MAKSDKDIVIVGIGETAHARDQGRSRVDLCLDATLAACADAGIKPSDITGLVNEAATAVHLQSEMHATLNLSENTFCAHISQYGPGIVATPILAKMAVEAGLAETFLCTWGITFEPSLSPAGGVHAADPYKANLEMPVGFFPQPVYMAAMANRYLAQYKVAPEKLSGVALSARAWSALNPRAVIKKPMTQVEYNDSPMIADPYHPADCCLLNDGACAFIMTTRERARDVRGTPVTVLAAAHAIEPVTEHEYLGVRADQMRLPSRFSAPRAMKAAGVTPKDIDLVHLYDCFAIIPVLQLEDMGFCGRGEALDLFASGATRPGGSLPVNTDGGHMAYSFIPGITHVLEAVRQLRRDTEPARQVKDAQTALVGGWSMQEHTTLILGRG